MNKGILTLTIMLSIFKKLKCYCEYHLSLFINLRVSNQSAHKSNTTHKTGGKI